MKKNFVLILFFAIGASLSAQELVGEGRCMHISNSRLINGLGAISFASDREWRVEGSGMVQIWSAAVQADSCSNAADFLGMGESRGQRFSLIGCRSNPDYPGDFFTWCAVVSFASTLCPEPWRVPTAEDFCNLDKILIGQSSCFSHTTTPDNLVATYIDKWGGALGGGAGSRGSLFFGGVKAYYWSATEYDGFYAFYLNYDVHGSIRSQCTENTKALGFSLRCVRDAE